MDVAVICFDFDGTLVDSLDTVYLENRRIAMSMGLVPLPREMFTQRGNMSWAQFVSKYLPDADVEEYLSNYRLENEAVEPMPGVPEVLEDLSEGYHLAIASGRLKDAILHHLEILGIDEDLFNVIIGRDDVLCQKPAPDCLLKVAKSLAIPAKRIVYVGDTLVDLATARGASAFFIGVLTGEAMDMDFSQAGANDIIETIEELPDCLLFDE